MDLNQIIWLIKRYDLYINLKKHFCKNFLVKGWMMKEQEDKKQK